MEEYLWIGIAIIVLVTLYLVFKLRLKPFQLLGRLMVHMVIGAFVLFFVNLLTGFFDFAIPLNLITVAIAGILGIPGILALVCIKLFVM